MRRFVDEAHAHGMGVILDVVYNHIGPDGNYLEEFSPDYFTDGLQERMGRGHQLRRPRTPGRCASISSPMPPIGSGSFIWMDCDWMPRSRCSTARREHIMAVIGEAARAKRPAGRGTLIVAENETAGDQAGAPVRAGGYGLDALWNDDFHHSAMVALTGRNEAYYTDYLGRPQEFISAVKYGYLYQGQWYTWQKKRRGHARCRIAAGSIRELHPEPRSDGQFHARRAGAYADQPRPATRP